MFSFTWNAPPEFPEIRAQQTHVVIRFKELDSITTKITLSHDGWGDSDQWVQVRRYFLRAWGKIVLPRLLLRFTDGPIDWNKEN